MTEIKESKKLPPPAADTENRKEKKMQAALQPLTLEEQEVAENNIGIVDKFLRKMRLDPSEFYDVVIFGYLEGIQRACRNASDEFQDITGLLWTCMKRKVGVELRYRTAM